MKKFLSIIVLSLLWSGSLYAKEAKFICNFLHANGKPDLKNYYEYHIKNNKVYFDGEEYTDNKKRPGYKNIIFNKENIYFETFSYWTIVDSKDKIKDESFMLNKNILDLKTKILTSHYYTKNSKSADRSGTRIYKCQIILLKK